MIYRKGVNNIRTSFTIALACFLTFELANSLQAQWIQSQGMQNQPITGLGASSGNLVAGSYCALCSYAYVFLSTDSGASWTLQDAFHVNNKSPVNPFWLGTPVTFLADAANLYAGVGGGFSGNVYLSTDHGLSWSQKDTSFIQDVNSLTAIGGTIFAGTNDGVYLSTDNGTSWSASNTGLSYGDYDSLYGHAPQVMRMVVRGTDLFAGTTGEGVFRSTNNGASWSAVDTGLTNTDIYGLAVIGTNIFAGAFQSPGDSTGGVFVSTNDGSSWSVSDAGLTRHSINVLTACGTNLCAGTDSGVFVSTDNGASWKDISIGTPVYSLAVLVFAVSDSFLLAGTENGIWRYPLSQLATGVKSGPAQIPFEFVLKQNYPKPFKTKSTISYSLPQKSFVVLKLYDLLGREVRTIVNAEQDPGNYSRIIDANDLPSGVYFYQLQAGKFTDIKKMLLMK